MNKECEGNCEKHIGKIRLVNVKNEQRDWGEFSYCQEAIDEDKRRGFNVTIL